MRTGAALLITGAFAAAVPAVSAATPFEDYVVINEVESNVPGDPGGPDFIELYNNGPSTINFVDAGLSDSEDSHFITIDGSIDAGEYLVIEPDDDGTPGNFGLGNADSVRLYAEGETAGVDDPIDEYSWISHAATTFGRVPNGTGEFFTLDAASPGDPNVYTPAGNPDPAEWQGIVVNEVESNGDTYDWVELYNTTEDPVDISGVIITDDNDGNQVTVPDNTTIAAAGYAVVNVNDNTIPGNFGLGGNDEVRLFAPETVDIPLAVEEGEMLDRAKWSTHAPFTYGLDRPSATEKGVLRTTDANTKGSANSFGDPLPVFTSADVVINEVESDPQASPVPAVAGDWIELANRTGAALNIEGLALTDSDPTHTYTVEPNTWIPANGYLAIPLGTAFGLGNEDAARLFNAGDDTTLDTPIDETDWDAHAANTWGRFPTNVTGAFANTAGPTPNAAN